MKHLLNIRLALMAVALAFAGSTFTACEDDIEITNGSSTNPWGELDGTFGSVRSAAGAKMGTTLTLKNNSGATGYVYFELSKVSEQNTKVTFKVDEEALKAYNAVNGTSYNMYPGVTLESGGSTTIAAGKRKSDLLAVNIPAGQTGENLAVAITATADNGTTIASNNASYVYLIKKVQIPTYPARDVKNMVYIEVNNENPLNAGEYTLGENTPFFDIVSIFAANINLDKDGAPYVSLNDQTAFVLHNADKIIRPLQEKGIKVHLTILGNHDDAGMRSLSDEGAKAFAKELKAYADIYGLDGFDFDDEYSSYSKKDNEFKGSSPAVVGSKEECTPERYANLMNECRQLMPKESNIALGIYWYTGSDYPKSDNVTIRDIVDYAVYGLYGRCRNINLSDYPATMQAPYAITLAGASTNDGSPIGINSNPDYLDKVKENYGMFAFYNLNISRNATRVFNEMSEVIYGEQVKWSGKYYERTEFAPKTGKKADYNDYLGTWTIKGSKSLKLKGDKWEQGEAQSFIINIIEDEKDKSYKVYGWDGREETQQYPFQLIYDNGAIKIASPQPIHTPNDDDGNEWVMSFASARGSNWNPQTVDNKYVFRGEIAPNGTLMLLDYNSAAATSDMKNESSYAFNLFKKVGDTYQPAIKAEKERLAGWYVLSR